MLRSPATRNKWLLVCMALSGCSDAVARTGLAEETVTTHSAPHRVGKDMAEHAGLTRLQVERAYKAHLATGLVLLKRPTDTDGGLPMHQKLAGTRAWLSLGAERVAAQDWVGAVECARAGLQELGKLTGLAARLRVRVFDDSVLKLGAADDLFKEGRVRDAAIMMLKSLEERTRLYVLYYADEIAE